MRFAVLTYRGFEDLCNKEIFDILGKKGEVNDSFVLVDCSFDEIYTFIYYTQSAREVLLFLSYSDDFPEINLDLKKKTFRVSSRKHIVEKFSPVATRQMEKKGIRVDLKEPFYDIYIEELGKYLFGIRLYDNFVKRPYRVYGLPGSVNAIIAFFMGFIYEGTLVDPFVKDGVIVIEKAIYYSTSPRVGEEVEDYASRFAKVRIKEKERKTGKIYGISDNFNHLKKAKMNAKIAMVNKLINFSSSPYFKEGDVVVTSPPLLSKHTSEKKITEIYEDLLSYGKFVFYLNRKSIELLRKLTEFNEIKVNEDFSVVYGQN